MMTEKKKLTLKGRSKKTESDSEAKKSTLSLKRRRKQVIVVDKKADQSDTTAEAQFASEAKAPPRPLGSRRKRKLVVNSNSRPNKPRKAKGGGHKISVAKKKAQAAPKKPQPQKKKLPQKELPKVKVQVVREPTPSQLLAKELNERLMEKYSVWREFKPLQLGVDEEVCNWIQTHDWGYSKRVIQKAFRLHTRNLRYRKAVAAGGQRYGLDGEPQGEIDDVAKTYARLKMQRCDTRTRYDEVEQSLYAEAGHVA